ncbi:hypothetical protein CEQ20_21510 [Yersinia pseudotuberculosis]|nr:hypothetical protein CEQ20_21510 [Yersinia pseudotuberculosis]AYX11354.1 hypothetical protein EGX52_11560 [Yersinia pseudotuberculosis]PEI15257.1 hypothetical protein CRM78_19900 [Yersinia pseudotuberculosis]PSH16823.1 hypothetical protein B7R75_03565 [Yersinia pseudotuberculosis]PSH35817.1 hypothetical protein BA192_13770 [Yersinia pseudotuberculosis]
MGLSDSNAKGFWDGSYSANALVCVFLMHNIFIGIDSIVAWVSIYQFEFYTFLGKRFWRVVFSVAM